MQHELEEKEETQLRESKEDIEQEATNPHILSRLSLFVCVLSQGSTSSSIEQLEVFLRKEPILQDHEQIRCTIRWKKSFSLRDCPLPLETIQNQPSGTNFYPNGLPTEIQVGMKLDARDTMLSWFNCTVLDINDEVFPYLKRSYQILQIFITTQMPHLEYLLFFSFIPNH